MTRICRISERKPCFHIFVTPQRGFSGYITCCKSTPTHSEVRQQTNSVSETKRQPKIEDQTTSHSISTGLVLGAQQGWWEETGTPERS